MRCKTHSTSSRCAARKLNTVERSDDLSNYGSFSPWIPASIYKRMQTPIRSRQKRKPATFSLSRHSLNTSGLVAWLRYRTFTLCNQLVLVLCHLGPKPFRARAFYIHTSAQDILVHHYKLCIASRQ